jgi:hypothetical protein
LERRPAKQRLERVKLENGWSCKRRRQAVDFRIIRGPPFALSGGASCRLKLWIPACAGMTRLVPDSAASTSVTLDPRQVHSGMTIGWHRRYCGGFNNR